MFSNFKENRKSKILITNAGGSLGKTLVPYLLRDGFKVTAFCTEQEEIPQEWEHLSNSAKERLRIEQGSLIHPDNYLPIVDNHQDIIHLAGIPYANKSDYDQDIILQQGFIEKAVAGRNVNFIWPRLPASKALAADPYFKALDKVENLIKRNIFRYRILHCSPIIGKGQPLFENMVAYVEKNKKVALPPWADKKIQFLYLNDFRYAVLEIIKRPGEWGYTIQLASGEQLTLSEVIDKILAFKGKDAKVSKSRLLSNKNKVIDSVFKFSRKISGQSDKRNRDPIGKKLILNELFIKIFENWENIENVDSFFGDIFYRPLTFEKVLNDYFIL